MSGQRQTQLILLVGIGLLLAGCSPRDLLFGTGAALGTAALQERGLSGAASDTGLRLAINDAWFKASLDLYGRCGLMISEGRVVITGRVPDEAMKQRVEALARQAGARDIINEVTVGADIPFTTAMQDKLIASQLRGSLTIDRDVSGINYAIAVSDGTVYLSGVAKSEAELRRVTFLASNLNGVRLVKSFAQIPESSYAENHTGGFQ
jgi:osmotically-inducible protein OsmY